MLGTLFVAPFAKAQTDSGVCVYQDIMYVGSPSACASLNGDLLLKSLAAPTASELLRFGQFGLRAMGYDPGPVDGVAGPQTRAAVKKFEDSFATDAKTNDQLDELFAQRFLGQLVQTGHFKPIESILPKQTSSHTEQDAKAAASGVVRLLEMLRRVRR